MKIIDFETKGNLIKFYLGDDDCADYWGDDWDDTPYEHNAGLVYEHFIKGIAFVYVDWDYDVFVPEHDWHYGSNSPFCKEHFKCRKAPCVIIDKADYFRTYSEVALNDKAMKFYFEDQMEPGTYFYCEDALIEK